MVRYRYSDFHAMHVGFMTCFVGARAKGVAGGGGGLCRSSGRRPPLYTCVVIARTPLPVLLPVQLKCWWRPVRTHPRRGPFIAGERGVVLKRVPGPAAEGHLAQAFSLTPA
jgi:hypothetical protein